MWLSTPVCLFLPLFYYATDLKTAHHRIINHAHALHQSMTKGYASGTILRQKIEDFLQGLQ
jgi:hypothetical protein